jgi:hypothetical protein
LSKTVTVGSALLSIAPRISYHEPNGCCGRAELKYSRLLLPRATMMSRPA